MLEAIRPPEPGRTAPEPPLVLAAEAQGGDGRGIVEVLVEVSGGPRLRVRAGSIERALRLAEGRFPGGRARVLFPIEPEPFFVGEPSLGVRP